MKKVGEHVIDIEKEKDILKIENTAIKKQKKVYLTLSIITSAIAIIMSLQFIFVVNTPVHVVYEGIDHKLQMNKLAETSKMLKEMTSDTKSVLECKKLLRDFYINTQKDLNILNDSDN